MIDGTPARCVSCGRRIEYVRFGPGRTDVAANHHCSDRHETKRRAANRRAEEPLDRDRYVNYGERLRVGFAAIGDDDEMDWVDFDLAIG